jgi:hypothetical protein
MNLKKFIFPNDCTRWYTFRAKWYIILKYLEFIKTITVSTCGEEHAPIPKTWLWCMHKKMISDHNFNSIKPYLE